MSRLPTVTIAKSKDLPFDIESLPAEVPEYINLSKENMQPGLKKYFPLSVWFLLILWTFVFPGQAISGAFQKNGFFKLQKNTTPFKDYHAADKCFLVQKSRSGDPSPLKLHEIGNRQNFFGRQNSKTRQIAYKWKNRVKDTTPFGHLAGTTISPGKSCLPTSNYNSSGQPHLESTDFSGMSEIYVKQNNILFLYRDKQVSLYDKNGNVIQGVSKRFVQSFGSTAARTTIGVAGGVFVHAGIILGSVMFDHSKGNINTDEARVYAGLGIGSSATDYGTDVITTYALAGTAIGSEVPVIGNFAGLIAGSIIGTGVFVFGNIFYKNYKMKINREKQTRIALADTACRNEYNQRSISALNYKAKMLEHEAKLLLAASMSTK